MSGDDDAPPRTFLEEQEELKNDFKAVVPDSDSESEDLLKIRPKSDAQRVLVLRYLIFSILPLTYFLQEKEEEEYKEWLKGRKEDISNEEMKKQLEPLKQYWSDPKLDENEAFLKDFFLNKR